MTQTTSQPATRPSFGSVLRAHRKERGLSVEALAAATRVPPSTISRYENDISKRRDPELVQRLVEYLHIPISVFLDVQGFHDGPAWGTRDHHAELAMIARMSPEEAAKRIADMSPEAAATVVETAVAVDRDPSLGRLIRAFIKTLTEK